MPTDFKLPELGENVTAGDVVRVLVAAGDTIEKDQSVLELETDKATIEVPSSVAGTVKDVRVKQGERIKVGQVVLTVDDGTAGAKEKEPKAAGKDKAQAKAKDSDGDADSKAKPEPADESDEEDTSEAAPAKVGGARRAEQERETGRADQPDAQKAAAPATDDGDDEDDKEDKEDAQPADAEPAPKAKRGEVVDIRGGARTASPVPAPADSGAPVEGPAAAAAPSVRRLARELGVEIRRLTGTGPGGRISVEDVQAFVRNAMSGGGAAVRIPLPDLSKWGEIERKPMSNIRRKTAEHLSHAWQTIPHVTQHDKADITALEELRKRYAPQAEQAGGKLTMTAIALKIVAAALHRFPQFNASADISRSEIVYRKSIHVGVAADTPRGLLVPVIRDVDRKGIFELSAELAKVSEKARGGKLSLDDMQGGGFTITNLGGIGGTSFTPIVNWPEVAILGISRGAQEPVYDGQQFKPRLMLPLSLSYDHRVIDGADAARFLRWVAEAFEQPLVLAL